MKTWKFNFRIIFPGWINCDAALATLCPGSCSSTLMLWNDIKFPRWKHASKGLHFGLSLKKLPSKKTLKSSLLYDYKSDSATSLQKLQIFGCIWKPLSTWVCLHVLQVEVCVCFFSDAVDMYMDNSINLIWTPTLTPLQSWNIF